MDKKTSKTKLISFSTHESPSEAYKYRQRKQLIFLKAYKLTKNNQKSNFQIKQYTIVSISQKEFLKE